MFPVGGVGVMLVGIAIAGVLCLALGYGLTRRLGALSATTTALLLWSLLVIGIITLIPANGAPGFVTYEGRLDTCSFEVGGPAPDGFWIFSGGQRLLNTVIFVPSGALLVLTAARWRTAWLVVPLGLVALAGYSAGIELTQLLLARLDRACDVTDVVDNISGAVIGAVIGLPAAVALRPWRHRPRSTA